jgi:hypothetical protein
MSRGTSSWTLALLGASCLVSCQRGPDPVRVRARLVVVPGATEVSITQLVVSYRVAEPYPAEATIKALNDALTRDQCTVSDKDPFNPEPGLPFGRWTEFTPNDGGPSTLGWSGAWICQPDGDVVAFGLQTTRDGARRPASSIDVKGAYYSSYRVRAARQLAGPIAVPRSSATDAGHMRRTAYQTCSICEATRKKVDDGAWQILYAGRDVSAHEHQWEDGVSDGTPASDGRVALVRQRLKLDDPTYAYGAFILRSQRFAPQERTDYEWAFRTDGGGVLDLATPAVNRGCEGSDTDCVRSVSDPVVRRRGREGIRLVRAIPGVRAVFRRLGAVSHRAVVVRGRRWR